MLRQLHSKRLKKLGSMEGSRKLRSRNIFAPDRTTGGAQDPQRSVLRSVLIFAKCLDSAHRKSPIEIVPGFLFRRPGGACSRGGRTKMGTSSPAWSSVLYSASSGCRGSMARLINRCIPACSRTGCDGRCNRTTSCVECASSIRKFVGGLRTSRQSSVPAERVHRIEAAECEVLPFGASRPINRSPRLLPAAKKLKALGTGAKIG